ncbi:MAG: response regulator [Planctomycetota bacterium]
MTLPDRLASDAQIFVVDDNAQNRELMAAYLDEVGGSVRLFVNGVEALAACDSGMPDLVLLDIMMPGTSGFQVCERLRALPGGAGIPVLMLTALNEVADVERAIEAGATDFLIKPVNRAELLTRVTALLAVRSVANRTDRAIADLRSLA